MLDATLSGSLFTRPSNGGTEIDLSRLESPVLVHEEALNSVDVNALTENLTSLSSTSIVWSEGANVLTLSGSGITPSSTVEELEASIDAGTADGTLNALSLTNNGTEILRVDIADGLITITSGIHAIEIAVSYPQTLSGLLDLVSIPTDIDAILGKSEAEFQEIVNDLEGFGVSSLSFTENGDELIGLTLGGDVFAALSLVGFTATVEGAFPEDFAALLTALKAIEAADGDINAADDVEINGLTITDPDGALLLQVSGEGIAEGAAIETVTIVGTNDDEENLRLNSSDDDNQSDVVFSTFGLDDVHSLTDGNADLSVLLEAGDDWTSINVEALAEFQGFGQNYTTVSLDGGADYDTMSVYLEAGSTVRFNGPLYDINGFDAAEYEAREAAYAQNLYQPYDYEAYNTALNEYNATQNPVGDQPEIEDYRNDDALIDFEAYDADIAARDAAFAERYGTAAPENYPNIDDYKAPRSETGLSESEYSSLQPWDMSAYEAAQNDDTNNGVVGEYPDLTDFPSNLDVFDHDTFAQDLAAFYAASLNEIIADDTAYYLEPENAPEISDFRLDLEGLDYDAYEAAKIELAEDLGVELSNQLYPIDRNESDFRTSALPEDYLYTAENTGQAFDWDAYSEALNAFYSSGGTGEGPSQYDFKINEDRYDHAAMEAYEANVRTYRDNEPQLEDFAEAETVSINIGEGTLSIAQSDEVEVASAEFENFEHIAIGGDGMFDVLGGEENDRLRINSIEANEYEGRAYVAFDGGDGVDRVEFDRTYTDYEAEERGITQEDFLENFDLVNRTDGSIDVVHKDDGHIFMSLSNVEQFRFLDEDAENDQAYADIVDFFDGLNIVGTENEDTLNGSSGDDTVSALGSADYISGNGGDDSVDAGAGDDIISILDGDSTVEGGEGYDSLRVTGFEGERLDIDFTFENDESRVQVSAFDIENGMLGSVEGSNIERVGVGFDGDIRVTGDGQDNTIKLVSAPTSLEFDGGDGIDEFQLHELTISGDLTDGTTRTEFEETFRLIEGEDGTTLVESRETGESRGQVTSVENFRFAADNEAGFETVAFDDLTIFEQVATVEGTDPVALGTANETYTASDDGQTVQGGGGDDDLNGGAGGDNLDGGDDDDAVDGGAGNDTVAGGEGEDTVSGGEGDDTVDGGDGNDTVDGGSGQDELNGGDGDDLLLDAEGGEFDGGDGNDTAIAQSGNNTFEEDDTIVVPVNNQINDFYCGGYGDDNISTGAGNDILIGDANSLYFFGMDRLDGGTGIDLLQGGGNADVFVFEAGDTTAGGQDIIGKFDLNDIFTEWGMAPNDDINNISASGADFQIGIDTVELNGFDAVEAGILANLDNFLTDTNDGAVFEAAGVKVLFADIAEADLLAADVNDVFVFV